MKKIKYKSGFKKRRENNKKCSKEYTKNMHDINMLFASRTNQVNIFILWYNMDLKSSKCMLLKVIEYNNEYK